MFNADSMNGTQCRARAGNVKERNLGKEEILKASTDKRGSEEATY